MYKSFKIKNFRCFEELELNELARVNLIAGKNNVGKTTLLEAIFLHCGMYNPILILKINAFRGIEVVKLPTIPSFEHPFNSIFKDFDVKKVIELSGENDMLGGNRTIRISVPINSAESEDFIQGNVSVVDEGSIKYDPKIFGKITDTSMPINILKLEHEWSGGRSNYYLKMDKEKLTVEPTPPVLPFIAYFQSSQNISILEEQAELYDNLVINNKEDDILKALKIIEPRLTKIRSVSTKLGSILYGDIGIGNLIPLPLIGGGIVRLAGISLHIANAPKGVVLIDEFENGLHHSVMTKIWQAVNIMSEETNTQIFATTHSWECIKSAHKAFSESKCYDFRLHRLEYFKDKIHAITYSQEDLDSAVNYDMEVR